MATTDDAAPVRLVRFVGSADKARSEYLEIPFRVPAGATRFDLRYRYPRADDCIIDLGLGDPDLSAFPSRHGLAGWSGGARSQIFVATETATPGYRPGIRPGKWTVILGLYRVPDGPVPVDIEISFDFAPRAPAAPSPVPEVVRREAGWYRGDLHCHTHHSDAKGSPEQLHATALREGLDFLAVTDHNTMTAHAAYFDTASSPAPVFVPGYEFTTGRGHGNVFGAREVADFRTAADQDVQGMIDRVRKAGGLFSINHDKPDIPWDYPVPEIDCMEVWQAPWLAGNFVALERYQSRLAQGRRLTAIGGSDFHQPDCDETGNLATLARPCTFLWCEDLSVPGILDALKCGRSFVSEAPDGPRLVLTVGEVGHGGAVDAGRAIALDYHATGAMGDRLELWDASGCIATHALTGPDETGTLRLKAVHGFLRGQIVADASRDALVAAAMAHLAAGRGGRMDWSRAFGKPVLRALTSPIYVARNGSTSC